MLRNRKCLTMEDDNEKVGWKKRIEFIWLMIRNLKRNAEQEQSVIWQWHRPMKEGLQLAGTGKN